MSGIGLHSGIYQQLREHAQLVDNVIIGLKDGSSSADDHSRRKLGKLLLDLADERYDDPSNRLIVLLLHGRGDVSETELARIGHSLLSPAVDNSIIESLEQFAQSLEREQASAMARVLGRAH